MSESKLVSSSSLKLLILVLVGAFVLASSSTVQAQLGFPVVDVAPNNAGDQQLTPDGFGNDHFVETSDGTLFYFNHWGLWLHYSASTDGGTTWSDHNLGEFPTSALEDRVLFGTAQYEHVIVEGNNIHCIGAFYDGLHPQYGIGVFYSELVSNGDGTLSKVGVLNRNITGPFGSIGWEDFNAATVDSQGRIIVGWHNATTSVIEFYRSSDGTTWEQYNHDYTVFADVREGYMRLEPIFNDTIRVSILHDKLADPADWYLYTFTLDNGAAWDASQVNYEYNLNMDADIYNEVSIASDAADWLHVIYKEKTTDQYYHAIIAQGSLLQNTYWRSNVNITRIDHVSFGTHQLLFMEYDTVTKKFFYWVYDGTAWATTKTLAHYNAGKNWGGPVLPLQWNTTLHNFVALARYDSSSPDDAHLILFDFGAGDLEEVAPPPVPEFTAPPYLVFDEVEGWLFEYEDYHVTVPMAYCNETVSLSFQLKSGNWNATYNASDGSVSASSSEEIEVVNVEDNGNSTHQIYDIHFVLTQNIADQLDVPIYVSATGFYGNLNWTKVTDANIYNEGGLTNYSFIGWAGHEMGDHPFEVFSADTRTPTLIDPYGFDVRTGPLPVNEDESLLLEEIRADWEINLPYRTALADMYPTHRLDSYADPTDRGYYSGSDPFSFVIKDNQVDANRMLYAEKVFRRTIDAGNKELVSVQWAAMNPDTGLYGGSYRVQDQSIKLEGSAYMAAQIRFNASDGLQFYNSSSALWEEIQVVADYDWYLIRCDFNLTTQLMNITVNSVLKVEDAPFVDSECTRLGAFFMGTLNAVTVTNKFYTDVVHAWTDFDLPLGGVADVNQVYRKLQSWDMHLGYGIESPDGVRDEAMEQGYIEFGVEYVFGNVWVPEFSVRITPNATELNKRNNWIMYKVEWNHTSTGEIVKTDFIYGLYEADTKLGSDFLQREITSLFADFWVDQANSSSIVGGRVNVEWYGISDRAPWYQFWGQEWKPKITDIDRSQILMPLMDENGTIRQAFEIELCRIWARSYRSDVGTFHHKITQISQFETNEVLGTSRFEGQDTPYFNEPKTPAMSNAGLFAPVYALIGAIGRMIVTALISASNGFIGLADSVLTFLGLPTGFFHTIVAFLGLIPEYIVSLMVMVGTALNQLLGFITPLFTFITYIMTFGLVFLGQLISKQLEFWRLVVDIFQGGVGMPYNFWVDFNLQAFITLGLVMLPMTMYNRWSASRDPVRTATEDIGFAMQTVQFIIGFFKGIAELLSSLISLILELIPA